MWMVTKDVPMLNIVVNMSTENVILKEGTYVKNWHMDSQVNQATVKFQWIAHL